MTEQSKQFDTGDVQSDLGRKTARGGMILVIVQIASYATHFASTPILARLLLPSDFGLIAMAALAMAFANQLRSLGLSTATIQRENVTHRQLSALFWVNVMVAIGLAGLMTAISPAFAAFFSEPKLVGITLGLSIALIINGVGIQHGALLRRQMKFKVLAGRQIAVAIVGPSAAVTAALLGAGYWSLVILVLSQAVVSTTVNLIWAGWIPGLILRGAEAGSMIKFGAHVSLTNMASMIAREIDNLVIGKLAGAEALGFYSKAYSLLLLPVIQLNRPLTITLVPMLSRLQNDPVRFNHYYYRAVTLVASLSMPVVAFFLVTADELVLTLLGPNWTEVTDLFRLLSPAALLYSLLFATTLVYTSLGNVSRQSRWVPFSAVVMIAAIAIGAFWGLIGVAISVSVGRVLLFYPSLLVCYKGTPVNVRGYHRALSRPAIATLAASGISYWVGLAVDPDSYLMMLGLRAAVFGAVYVAVWVALPGGTSTVRDLKSVFKRRDPEPSQAIA